MVIRRIAVFFVFLWACSPTLPSSPSSSSPGEKSTEMKSGEFYLDEDSRLTQFVGSAKASGNSPDEIASSFASGIADKLGLAAGKLEVLSSVAQRDGTTVRQRQTFNSLPVFGAELGVVVDGDGHVVLAKNDLVDEAKLAEVAESPELSQEEFTSQMNEAFGVDKISAELGYLVHGDSPTLAYRFVEAGREYFFSDSGEILDRRNVVLPLSLIETTHGESRASGAGSQSEVESMFRAALEDIEKRAGGVVDNRDVKLWLEYPGENGDSGVHHSPCLQDGFGSFFDKSSRTAMFCAGENGPQSEYGIYHEAVHAAFPELPDGAAEDVANIFTYVRYPDLKFGKGRLGSALFNALTGTDSITLRGKGAHDEFIQPVDADRLLKWVALQVQVSAPFGPEWTSEFGRGLVYLCREDAKSLVGKGDASAERIRECGSLHNAFYVVTGDADHQYPDIDLDSFHDAEDACDHRFDPTLTNHAGDVECELDDPCNTEANNASCGACVTATGRGHGCYFCEGSSKCISPGESCGGFVGDPFETLVTSLNGCNDVCADREQPCGDIICYDNADFAKDSSAPQCLNFYRRQEVAMNPLDPRLLTEEEIVALGERDAIEEAWLTAPLEMWIAAEFSLVGEVVVAVALSLRGNVKKAIELGERAIRIPRDWISGKRGKKAKPDRDEALDADGIDVIELEKIGHGAFSDVYRDGPDVLKIVRELFNASTGFTLRFTRAEREEIAARTVEFSNLVGTVIRQVPKATHERGVGIRMKYVEGLSLKEVEALGGEAGRQAQRQMFEMVGKAKAALGIRGESVYRRLDNGSFVRIDRLNTDNFLFDSAGNVVHWIDPVVVAPKRLAEKTRIPELWALDQRLDD